MEPAVANGRFGFQPAGSGGTKTSHRLQSPPVAPQRSSPIASQSHSREALQEEYQDGSDADIQSLRFQLSSNDPDLQQQDEVETRLYSPQLTVVDMNESDVEVPAEAEAEADNDDLDADGEAYDGAGLGDVDRGGVFSDESSELEYINPPVAQVNPKKVRVHIDDDKVRTRSQW